MALAITQPRDAAERTRLEGALVKLGLRVDPTTSGLTGDPAQLARVAALQEGAGPIEVASLWRAAESLSRTVGGRTAAQSALAKARGDDGRVRDARLASTHAKLTRATELLSALKAPSAALDRRLDDLCRALPEASADARAAAPPGSPETERFRSALRGLGHALAQAATALGLDLDATPPARAAGALVRLRDEVRRCDRSLAQLEAPRADRPYAVHVEHAGVAHDFQLSFTPELAQLLAERGVSVDAARGELVGKRVTRLNEGVDGDWATRTGAPAPPYLIAAPDSGVAGLPSQRLEVGLRDGALHLSYGPLRALDHEDWVAGRRYPVTTAWRGETYTFEVELAPATAAWMNEHGVRLDFATGVTSQGQRTLGRLDAETAANYRERTGNDAPPWLFRSPDGGHFGIPEGVLRISGTDGRWVMEHERLQSRSFFRRESGEGVAAGVDRTPVTWRPSVLTVSPRLKIEAPRPELAERARALVERTTGRARRELERRLPAIREEQKQLRALDRQVAAARDPQAIAALVDTAKSLLGVRDDAPWSALDASAALAARASALDRFVDHDVQVVVVPKGHHWTAMPHVSPAVRERYADSTVRAANHRDAHRTTVFLPEEDLSSAVPWVSTHELVHLWEHNYLDEATVKRIDAEFERSRKNDGPFAREYGTTRDEFMTTFAELWAGRHGPEGQAWLRDRVPWIHEQLERAHA